MIAKESDVIPVLSIIIVCRNDATLLKDTLENIEYHYTQSPAIRDGIIEVIIKDGKSTDETWEIIKKYPYLKAYTGLDSGIYDAMNIATSNARGKYLFYLNAGDKIIMDPIWCQKLVNNLLRYRDDDLIACSSVHRNSDGSKWKMNPINDIRLLPYGNIFSHQGVFILNSKFQSLHGYDPNIKIVSDWHFFNRVIQSNGTIYFIEASFCETAPFGISSDPLSRALERFQSIITLCSDENLAIEIIPIYKTLIAIAGAKLPAVQIAQTILEINATSHLSIAESAALYVEYANHKAGCTKTTTSEIASTIDAASALDSHCQNLVEPGIEERLIFLVSMPRSGSTLLQRILESDNSIFSTGEPWIALPPLSMKNPWIVESRFSTQLAIEAEEALHSEVLLPADISAKAIKNYLLTYYSAILKSRSGHMRYLDKTPRYVHVLKELFSVLPQSKYIVLMRNPLDIALSYASTWGDYDFKNITNIPSYVFDFEHGLANLHDFATSSSPNKIVLDFEDLCAKSPNTLHVLNKYLDITLADFSISQTETQLARQMGDPKQINIHSTPQSRPRKSLAAKLAGFRNLDHLLSLLSTVPDRVWSYFSLSKTEILDSIGKVSRREEGTSFLPGLAAISTQQKEYGLVITSYNNRNDIIRCLDSVFSSRMIPDEVIIADDNSTDDTASLISEYIHQKRPANVSLVQRPSNIGVAANRDLAIRELDCRYICTLDGDDIVSPLKFYAELKALLESQARVAFSDIKIIQKDGTHILNTRAYHHKTMPQCVDYLCTRSKPVPRDLSIDKRLYLETGGFVHGLNIYEDWNLKQKLALHSCDYEWVHSGYVGTHYYRISPGLSKRTPLQHCIAQIVALSLNKTLIYGLGDSAHSIILKAIRNLLLLDREKSLQEILPSLDIDELGKQHRLPSEVCGFLDLLALNWHKFIDLQDDHSILSAITALY